MNPLISIRWKNALCPVADNPKLLDFRPIEAHGFSHHRLRTDQAAGGHRIALRLQGAVVMTYTHQEHVHVARKRISDDARLPRPGFKSTAVYFEWLAQKETRDYDRQQRLLEVARFYRSLAGIIPGMPEKYKDNGIGLPLTRAARWHARAEECRTLADCFTDPICRGQLTRLAQSYDEMAVAAE
jgi:hypothetical protein